MKSEEKSIPVFGIETYMMMHRRPVRMRVKCLWSTCVGRVRDEDEEGELEHPQKSSDEKLWRPFPEPIELALTVCAREAGEAGEAA